jgi:hypothetical protein
VAFKCGGVNAAGTGRNAYPTLGEVSTPADDGGLQGEKVSFKGGD